jgi:hypothetical protein
MDKDQLQALREIAMLLAIQVKRGMIQSTVIQEMASVGFTPKRIAELVGTTPNTVSVILSKKRKKN